MPFHDRVDYFQVKQKVSRSTLPSTPCPSFHCSTPLDKWRPAETLSKVRRVRTWSWRSALFLLLYEVQRPRNTSALGLNPILVYIHKYIQQVQLSLEKKDTPAIINRNLFEGVNIT